MSELINTGTSRATVRRQLLAAASALTLASYIASTSFADAEDIGRPTIWIELGGQMEHEQGTASPFVVPFMTAASPTPDVYANDIFVHTQRAPTQAFGLEGRVAFQPEDSNWVFSGAIRYGRSQTNRHVRQQDPQVTAPNNDGLTVNLQAAAFADTKSAFDQSHAILDFGVGRDVGLGVFGHDGTSVINAGVRFAQFSTRSNINASGRPSIHVLRALHPAGWPVPTFYNYTMIAHAERNFRGIGPSLSWDASAAIIGDKDAGEVTFDWGINGAVLFGRQKAKTDHTTQAYHMPFTPYATYVGYYYARVPSKAGHGARMSSRSIVVPNLGGFAGIAMKYSTVKFSLGYRADFFFGAVDAGVDEHHNKNLGFNGPFATISVGLGG